MRVLFKAAAIANLALKTALPRGEDVKIFPIMCQFCSPCAGYLDVILSYNQVGRRSRPAAFGGNGSAPTTRLPRPAPPPALAARPVARCAVSRCKCSPPSGCTRRPCGTGRRSASLPPLWGRGSASGSACAVWLDQLPTGAAAARPRSVRRLAPPPAHRCGGSAEAVACPPLTAAPPFGLASARKKAIPRTYCQISPKPLNFVAFYLSTGKQSKLRFWRALRPFSARRRLAAPASLRRSCCTPFGRGLVRPGRVGGLAPPPRPRVRPARWAARHSVPESLAARSALRLRRSAPLVVRAPPKAEPVFACPKIARFVLSSVCPDCSMIRANLSNNLWL